MDRINYNYSNQIYNMNQNPSVDISNTVHRSIPSHLSSARYHYNNQKGTGIIAPGPQNQSGFYSHPPYQTTNSVPRYPSGFGDNFVKPSNSRTEKDTSINDEDFSEKLIAYARFNRNTDLIKTILSEVMVPDVRQVVTTTRIEVLKDQVRTLEDHHKKVDIEVNNMEQDYANKKRKFIESTAEYHRDYKKICRPAVGLQMYHGMVTKYYNYLKENSEQQQWEKTLAWAKQTASQTPPVVDDSTIPSNSVRAHPCGIIPKGRDSGDEKNANL